jgi:hypothetical protein
MNRLEKFTIATGIIVTLLACVSGIYDMKTDNEEYEEYEDLDHYSEEEILERYDNRWIGRMPQRGYYTEFTCEKDNHGQWYTEDGEKAVLEAECVEERGEEWTRKKLPNIEKRKLQRLWKVKLL